MLALGLVRCTCAYIRQLRRKGGYISEYLSFFYFIIQTAWTNFLQSTKSSHFPLKWKVDLLRKQKRVLYSSISIINLRIEPTLCVPWPLRFCGHSGCRSGSRGSGGHTVCPADRAVLDRTPCLYAAHTRDKWLAPQPASHPITTNRAYLNNLCMPFCVIIFATI